MMVIRVFLTVALSTWCTLAQAQYYDAETGLHYNMARYYDPKTGRYLSSDPIGLAGGMNTYTYVDNNPLTFIDPDGLTKWTGTAKAGGLVLGIGAGGVLFELESECVDGKRAFVTVLAVGPGFGVGVKLPKLPKAIPSGTVGNVTFDDFLIGVLDPDQYSGPYKQAGISAVIAGGVGHQKIQCGHAHATVTGTSFGLDVGATGFAGSCTVINSRVEDCNTCLE